MKTMTDTYQTTEPITLGGRYSHTDGSVGHYEWVNGRPVLIRVAASDEAMDADIAREERAYEAAQIERETDALRADLTRPTDEGD